jgi:PAS domain S-box-containing protein
MGLEKLKKPFLSQVTRAEVDLFAVKSFQKIFIMFQYVITVASVFLIIIAIYSNWTFNLVVISFSCIMFIFCIILSYRKFFRTASIVLMFSILIFATGSAVKGFGVYDVSIHVYYIVIALSSFILSRKRYFLILAVIVAVVPSIRFIQQKIFPDQAVYFYDTGDVFVIIISMIVTSVLIYFVSGIIKENYVKIANDALVIENKSLQLSDILSKYRNIYDNISDSYFETSPDGLIVHFSSEIEKSLGYYSGELDGKHFGDLFYDRIVYDGIISNLEAKKRLSNITARMKSKSGAPVYFQFTMVLPLSDTDKNIKSGITGTAIDVTQSKLFEEHVQHSQRIESIGLITASIVHDFNNILSVILANADLLNDEIGRNSPNRIYVDDILESTKKAAQLSRRLLSFSRGHESSPESINPCKIVKNVSHIAQRLVGDKILIENMCDDVLPNVLADPMQMEQILMNLIINARDALLSFYNPIKEIRIRASLAQNSNMPEDFFSRTDKQYIQFCVSDNGPGIDRNIIGKIFDPFFTIKDSGDGTGLGLAIVKGIVHQNGGWVDVVSEPGAGAAFNIYWPVINT